MSTALGCASYDTGVEEEGAVDESSMEPADELRSLGFPDANALMLDSDLEGDQDITAEDVQAMLDERSGPLATYKLNGRTAAQIIVEESLKNQISPVFMVARIQTETQLITSSKWVSKIPYATSYGCPDGKPCSSTYKGFDKQIIATAAQFRTYMDNIRAGKYAINGNTLRASDYGYLIGRTTKTLDPLTTGGKGCNVTPKNAATAAIYTYTPYVGLGVTSTCKSKEPGGFGLQLQTMKMARGWFSTLKG